MRKVKIVHLSSAHPDGDSRIFHKECVSLANNFKIEGVEIEVHLVLSGVADRTDKNVHVHSVPYHGKKRMNRMWTTVRQVYKKAIELDANIYHFHDPELLPYGLKLAKRGKKVIYDSHEDLPKQIMDKHWIPVIFRGLISKLLTFIEGYVARRISAVVSVNEPICDRFKKYNQNVVQVANYPLMDEVVNFQGKVEKVPGQICYVGGLSPTRGIKEMVQAMESTDASLVLAGNFVPASFEEEVRNLKGWKNVDFRGYINRQEIMNILVTSEVGLVTLHPTRSYLEALPIKMFEYMSAGTPVLASDFPLWRGIIEEANCGICVDPMDPVAISNGIDYILSDKVRAREMGENGKRAFKEKFNWRAEEEKLFSLYSTIISGK